MFSRKLQVKFQGVKIQQKQNYLKRYCFYYVHKTWLNGILVLNESSNILITSSENLREIAPFDFQKHWREYQLVLAVIFHFIKNCP